MDKAERIGNCSITVHLRQTQQVSGGGVLFEACRVGSVDETDGSMILNWNLGELTRLRPSMSTEQVTNELSDMLFQPRPGQEGESGIQAQEMVETLQAVTDEDGTCTFRNLEEGAWIIHASDSSSYGKIEDTLVAVPCYVQAGTTWSGPVYDPDIWPKGDIRIQSLEEDPQTKPPQTEARQTEQRQTEPAKEKVPQTERPDTGEGDPVLEETQKTTEKGPPSPKKKKVPESEGRRKIAPPSMTGQSTQVVKTLDETPLTGLVCAFLAGACVIALILARMGRKRRRRREGLLLLLLCTGSFLAAGTLHAHASEGAVSFEPEGDSRILFVNESPSAPCLTVSKEVLNAENGSRPPRGDQFVFRLFLDTQRASGVRYRVFSETGEELVDLTGNGELVPAGTTAADPVSLRTGRDGSFTLCGGQYALFEDVSEGQLWEVQEVEDAHYERVVPGSTDTLSGTILREGSTAAYVNRYVPEEEKNPEEGCLEITKRILWPEDCALITRGSFRFRVLADGSPWKNARVQVQDDGEGENHPVTTIRTDENGIFEIRGNQRATLQPIPVGTDLTVEELDDPEDAFVPSGNTVWRGSAASRAKAVFTNRLAAFTVTKSLRSGDAEDIFLFCLLGADRLPMGGVSFWVFDEDGNPVSEDPVKTNAAGHFALKAGQKAVFTGLAEGTVYSVREEGMLGYRQVVPESSDGYTNLTVKNGIPVLRFENERTQLRMSVPSLGGSGIGILMAAALAGMILSAVLYHRHHGAA